MTPQQIITKYPPARPIAKEPNWHKEADDTLVFVQEKLRGIRGLFCQGRFYSRNGNEFIKLHNTRAETDARVLTSNLPPHLYIDGELFHPDMTQQDINSAVMGKEPNNLTAEIFYYPFDFTAGRLWYSQRWAGIESIVKFNKFDKIKLLKTISHRNAAACSYDNLLAEVIDNGGEGLVVKLDHEGYPYGDTELMARLKGQQEEEGICLGYKEGTGKNKGLVGSYHVRRANGKLCYVSGLSDAQRSLPVPLGQLITFKYTELNKYGNPQDPRFVAVRYNND